MLPTPTTQASSPSTNASPAAQPPPARQPRQHPCILCTQRKVRCDRQSPCANCVKARADCISTTALPPRKRKKRFAEAELLARLRRYEELLQGYGADLKEVNEGITDIARKKQRPTEKVEVKETGKLEPVVSEAEEREPEGMRSLAVRRSLRGVESNMWTRIDDEYRETEEILAASSEEDTFQTAIRQTLDHFSPEEKEDFLFRSPETVPLQSLHPSPLVIFRLWQRFLDSVNPLVRIFHAPTVQQQILDASSDLNKVSRPVEALMFSIYASAIYSMSDDECRSVYDEERSVLLERYRLGVQRALHRAGFLRSSDITVLQAFVLFLISSLLFTQDPRSVFCLAGVALRIAHRMGLSYDGTNYGLRPFEIEMRRRLWWQLVLIDMRIADLSGAGASSLSYQWTTKLPLNVNDSDLFPGMRDTPAEHPGITEMVFVLPRCEICKFHQRPEMAAHGGSAEAKAKARLIDELEARLKQRYLDFCDPSVPFHLLAMQVTKMAVLKLRMGPQQRTIETRVDNEAPQSHRDEMFSHAVTIVEIHSALATNTSMRPFLWHLYMNYPMPAHAYLIFSLRNRGVDELTDRAWAQLAIKYDLLVNGGFLKRRKKDSPMHVALADLTIKAWEVREKALLQFQPSVPTPKFIEAMRQTVAKSRGKGNRGKPQPSASEVNTAAAVPDSAGWVPQDQEQDRMDVGMGMGMGAGMVMGMGMGMENGMGMAYGAMDNSFAGSYMSELMPQDPSMGHWDLFGEVMGTGSMSGFDNF